MYHKSSNSDDIQYKSRELTMAICSLSRCARRAKSTHDSWTSWRRRRSSHTPRSQCSLTSNLRCPLTSILPSYQRQRATYQVNNVNEHPTKLTSTSILPIHKRHWSTLHPTPFTLHPTPFTLHPTPYNLHPTPYTLHPAPFTLHPAR